MRVRETANCVHNATTGMEGSTCYQVAVPYAPHRKIDVRLSPANDRKPSQSAELEAKIETTWRRRKAENANLFNASKFRLARIDVTPDAITLHLGLTDYKTYLATHAPPNPLQEFGLQCMALPVGNVVIPITCDGYTFMLVRSENCAEGKLKCVFPGGHAEPSYIGHMGERDCNMVRHELIHSARRELLEELFVEDVLVEKLEHIKFLGIVRRSADWKCSMVFCAGVLCDASRVEECYRQRNVQKEESVRLVKCAVDDLIQTGVERCLPREYEAMPELLGASELFAAMMRSSSGLAAG